MLALQIAANDRQTRRGLLVLGKVPDGVAHGPEDFADLQRILDAQRRKLKTNRSAIVEDTAFHSALARSTGNRVVVSIKSILNDLLVESRTLALNQKGRPELSVEGHEAVVRALRSRDPEGASRAMSQHIDQIADLQLRAREHPTEPTS